MKSLKYTKSLAPIIAVAVFLYATFADVWAADTESALTHFTAHYKVLKGGIPVAETSRSVKPINKDTFAFKSETNPRGVVKWIADAYVMEQSIWKFDQGDMRPLEYTYKNISGDKTRTVKLLFDWRKKRVTNIINGDPWHMDLLPGLQDKLLFQLKMMQDLRNNRRDLHYAVADGGRIKEYVIDIAGTETLDTDLGHFNTIRLTRTTDTKTTTWWCAEQLHYLPIKIQQQKKDGGRVVAELYKLEGIVLPAARLKQP